MVSDAKGSDDELLEEIDRLSREIDSLKEAEKSLNQRNRNLILLTSITTEINQTLELQEVVDLSLEVTIANFGVEAGLLCLFDNPTQTFIPASYRGVSDKIVEALTNLKADEGVPGEVGTKDQPMIFEDLSEQGEVTLEEAVREGLTFGAGFPIRGEGGLLGVMILLAADAGHVGPEHLEILEDLGQQIGCALANARLFRHTKNQIVEHMMGDRQRTQVLTQVQEQVANLHTILDALPFALLLLDKEARVVLGNSTAEDEMEDLIGAEEGEILAKLGDKPIRELLQPPASGAFHEIEKDGRRYQVAGRSVGDDDGEDEGSVLEIREAITDSEDAPEKPEVSGDIPFEPMVGTFAHHLDRGLGVIGLFAGMLMTADLSPRQLDRLRVICNETRRVEDLIRKLMDYTQQAVYSQRPLKLDDLVSEAIAEYGSKGSDETKLELVHSGEDFPVQGNPEALRQVVLNLLVNGGQAMTEGGQLQIALRRIDSNTLDEMRWPGIETGNWLQLTVTDTGDGIPYDVLPQIFDPFFTTRNGGDAVGLGLSQAQGIVKQHGGRLDVISQKGTGSTFAVHLPAIAVEAEADEADASVLRADGPGQTLVAIVRDETMREGLVETLTELGYVALGAASVQEASAIIAETKVEVILFETEGREAVQARSELLDSIPDSVRAVLVSSASMDEESVLEQGWDGWIQSPPKLEKLAEAVAWAFR